MVHAGIWGIATSIIALSEPSYANSSHSAAHQSDSYTRVVLPDSQETVISKTNTSS